MDGIKKLYHALDSFENKFFKICELLGALAMAIAFCSVFLQVLYRYVLSRFANLPFSFTEELARYCLFWVIYLLLPSGIKLGMEAANTFLPSKLTGAPKTALYLIVRGFCVIVAVIAFINSFKTLQTNWLFTSPVMGLPGFFKFGPVVIGMGLVIIRYVIELLGFACGEIKPFENIGKGGVE